jgi:hypothetical protein
MTLEDSFQCRRELGHGLHREPHESNPHSSAPFKIKCILPFHSLLNTLLHVIAYVYTQLAEVLVQYANELGLQKSCPSATLSPPHLFRYHGDEYKSSPASCYSLYPRS